MPLNRKTKIVATIGPASIDEDTIRSLIQAGMNVARLNFSHGEHEDHLQALKTLRHYSERLGTPVAVMQDLQGPKIRTGTLKEGKVRLNAGESVTLTTDRVEGDEEKICVDFPDLPFYVKPGSRVLIADGQIELVVKEVEGKEVETECILGGVLTSHKGVNLPGADLDIPGFTKKDEHDLKFGLEHGVDAVAISFVRSSQDISRVRNAAANLHPDGMNIPIIAKLERPEALSNLESIIQLADGVMVARGDLGVEMSPEEVPIAQKRIIETANRHGKIVITATQMLESMIENPRPTRAEASDVANAIFDGTDAVMLSGETAVGNYPVNSVKMMDAIIRKAEPGLEKWGHWKGFEGGPFQEDAVYLVRAASELANDRNVAAIAAFTKTGSTTRLMSKARPGVPILGFTPDEPTYRIMSVYWGVVPHLVPFSDTMEGLLVYVESAILAETPIQPGQQVVLICGFPVDEMRPSNLLLLHTVGQRS